jgi:isochorismate hydrolase
VPIPIIHPYAMPDPGHWPENRVPWRPDAGRSVLLIHDMQRYFLQPFTAESPPLTTAIPNMSLLRRQCAAAAVPVCYTMQPGGQSIAERGLLLDFWGPGLSASTDVTRIVEELTPTRTDTILVKRRYSAFHQTSLLELMRRERRDQLIVCGVYAHIGCLVTAIDAFMNGVQSFMVADAVADFSAADHMMALRYAVQQCSAIFSTKQVMDALRIEFARTTEVEANTASELPDVPFGESNLVKKVRLQC